MNSSELAALSPVIPVVVVDDAATAVPLAEALLAGGIRTIELTLRTPAGLDAIAAVARDVPEMVVGAGTVLTPAQATAATEAGAQFLVTPGTTPALLDAALATGLPVLPGVATVSEALAAAERGIQVLKFFPAEANGGRPVLKAWAGPLAELRFCPTGGITPQNAADYLALGNVVCVGGSWLTPKELIRAGDWAAIESLAREATALPRA